MGGIEQLYNLIHPSPFFCLNFAHALMATTVSLAGLFSIE